MGLQSVFNLNLTIIVDTCPFLTRVQKRENSGTREHGARRFEPSVENTQ